MKLYIRNISRCAIMLCMMVALPLCASAQMHKMSSYVRQKLLLNEGRQTIGSPLQGSKQAAKGRQQGRRMTAFVRTKDTGVLHANGCHVLASFGDIHIASIPMDRLRQLAASDAVSRIEAGRSCTALMDSAVVTANVPRLWESNVAAAAAPSTAGGLRGTGVVVGLMDIGFDLTFPGFYSDDGQRYRIKAMWDMLDRTTGGAPVEGTDTTYVGRQYVGEEELLGVGHSYDGYIVTHGTHTAYTAVGSKASFVPAAREALRSAMPYGGNEQLFSGVASDADICLVANATTNNSDSIPEELDDMYTTALDVLGFKYIFDYADAHHQPCVISFSEGSRPDLYGDDVLYAEALNSMLGPGHIMCAAAGNEAMYDTYVQKPLGKQQAGAFMAYASGHAQYLMRSSDKMTLRVTFHLNNKPVEVREYHTDQCIYDEETGEVFADTLVVNNREFVVLMAAYPSCYNEKEWATELLILATDKKTIGRDIPISMTLLGDTVRSEIIGMGGSFKRHDANPELADFERSHNIHSPGGLPGIICVGSVNSRRYFYSMTDNKVSTMNWGTIGNHSNFSSVGPSLCGLTKPDISAPGCFVVSANSSFIHETRTDSWDSAVFDWNGRTYVWHADCGTSMACPVAAGIVATWLQVCPTLTPAQAMEAMAATAVRNDDFHALGSEPDETGYAKNNYYGYGIIDAYAGLKYVLDHFTGISEVTVSGCDADDATYDLMGRRVSTLRPGAIYIRNGNKFVVRQ